MSIDRPLLSNLPVQGEKRLVLRDGHKIKKGFAIYFVKCKTLKHV